MTVVDSPEMLLFADTARAFLEKEGSLSVVRTLHDAGASFDRQWWRRAAELGWAGLLVDEKLGGGNVSGNGVRDLALVAQLCGKTVAPGPLHPVSTVLAGLAEAENALVHRNAIESLISGESVAAWAVYEPGARWAPLAPKVTATATADGYRIQGTKDRVEAGADCDLVLVVAASEGGVRQLLVPADAPGVRIRPVDSIDIVKRYALIEFDDVEAGRDAVVGTADQTPDIVARQGQIAQLLQCCEMVGILDAVLDFTIRWAFDRHTFGRPLASYQALKHRFADMRMWLEACRATTEVATADIASGSPEADVSISIAKSYVGERAPQIVQGCVQMHGGIGVTWEHDLHLYLRRVVLHRALFGTPEEHNLRVYAGELESAR